MLLGLFIECIQVDRMDELPVDLWFCFIEPAANKIRISLPISLPTSLDVACDVLHWEKFCELLRKVSLPSIRAPLAKGRVTM